jgi:nucleotide-binding universal stress UspA family protein
MSGDGHAPPRVIHATDFSDEAQAAEAEAVRLTRALGGELLLVHVAAEPAASGETPSGMQQLATTYKAQARRAEDELAARARRLSGEGVATGWRRYVGVPHEQIVQAAAKERARYIVIGTHGRGTVDRFLLGSVVERVLRTAGCPVVVVRKSHAPRRRRLPHAASTETSEEAN